MQDSPPAPDPGGAQGAEVLFVDSAQSGHDVTGSGDRLAELVVPAFRDSEPKSVARDRTQLRETADNSDRPPKLLDDPCRS
jgi:hypothetical protein